MKLTSFFLCLAFSLGAQASVFEYEVTLCLRNEGISLAKGRIFYESEGQYHQKDVWNHMIKGRQICFVVPQGANNIFGEIKAMIGGKSCPLKGFSSVSNPYLTYIKIEADGKDCFIETR